MSLTVGPSLHRFVPRRAHETTAFGYEVIARSQGVDDCIAVVQWADCWCPDAAQFILVQASDDLGAATCESLIHAIDDSHLRPKIRLVCRSQSLADDDLIAILHRKEIGFLLETESREEIESLAETGILGVRVNAHAALRSANETSPIWSARQLLRVAHDLGLRSIASQSTASEEVGDLLALGFDYVSCADGGFVPAEPGFAWQRKLA